MFIKNFKNKKKRIYQQKTKRKKKKIITYYNLEINSFKKKLTGIWSLPMGFRFIPILKFCVPDKPFPSNASF